MNVFINDVRYNVETTGNGFPLMLLHGFTGNSTTWAPFYDVWGKHSRLIIPDIIGHGKTDSPTDPDRYKIERVAGDLAAILDALQTEQVDILGYSMGGRLALTFAVMFPRRVRRLVLESASPGLATEDERAKRRMKDVELANFIMDQGIKNFVDYWEEIPLFASMKRLPIEKKLDIRQQRLGNSPIGLANSLLGMGTGSQPSWWEHLGQLKCEVLLLTGEEDKKFCQIAQAMLPKLKKASLIEFENSGHTIHVENCEKFGRIVSDFVTK
ncbi:2-succinyl-6-hydroxy-2,4-cyclohexadiene-1-carboxylate synthase [Neobacillus sedimentimangrovi]|uniref:Putative 2-succinyl-6-hydroxy-2,4-cyclohexadiene-1-carboxylate synthase n=1 Tax=Neobacillus sedimentimangrovi TaxID=2699460 RepID=A0ABS8QK13_9BACI|nr:2-succinyl-6-hydroxy-2,4-cyclohexadiene-1-carboxylate synthase [Neobacillus sedimentimangrovi]